MFPVYSNGTDMYSPLTHFYVAATCNDFPGWSCRVDGRPEPIEPVERTFLESGWAALLVAIGFLVLLALAVVVGRLA